MSSLEQSQVLASEEAVFKEVKALHKEGRCNRCWWSGVDEDLICCYRVDERIKTLSLTDNFQTWLKNQENVGLIGVNECYMMVWAILRGYSPHMSFTKDILKRLFEQTSEKGPTGANAHRNSRQAA